MHEPAHSNAMISFYGLLQKIGGFFFKDVKGIPRSQCDLRRQQLREGLTGRL